MANIIQNRQDFKWERAVKIYEHIAHDKTKCVIWKDQVSNACHIKHFAHKPRIKKQMGLIANMRRADYTDKSNSFFSAKKHGGDRTIAFLTPFDLVHHPEIRQDPKELLKFLDRNPARKYIPAMWTRTTPGKRLFGGIKDTAIVRAR